VGGVRKKKKKRVLDKSMFLEWKGVLPRDKAGSFVPSKRGKKKGKRAPKKLARKLQQKRGGW